jgi:hypothetical protein
MRSGVNGFAQPEGLYCCLVCGRMVSCRSLGWGSLRSLYWPWATWQAEAHLLTMVNANYQPLAVPSTIDADGVSFSVVHTSAPAIASIGGTLQRPARAPTAIPTPCCHQWCAAVRLRRR